MQKPNFLFTRIRKPEKYFRYNMGLSAMLAEEHILIDISLSAASWCDFSS